MLPKIRGDIYGSENDTQISPSIQCSQTLSLRSFFFFFEFGSLFQPDLLWNVVIYSNTCSYRAIRKWIDRKILLLFYITIPNCVSCICVWGSVCIFYIVSIAICTNEKKQDKSTEQKYVFYDICLWIHLYTFIFVRFHRIHFTVMRYNRYD